MTMAMDGPAVSTWPVKVWSAGMSGGRHLRLHCQRRRSIHLRHRGSYRVLPLYAANGVGLQSTGNIVVYGMSGGGGGPLVRLNAKGSLDHLRYQRRLHRHPD